MYYCNIKCDKQKIPLIKLKDKFCEQKIENNYSVDIITIVNNTIEPTKNILNLLTVKLHNDSTFHFKLYLSVLVNRIWAGHHKTA